MTTNPDQTSLGISSDAPMMIILLRMRGWARHGAGTDFTHVMRFYVPFLALLAMSCFGMELSLWSQDMPESAQRFKPPGGASSTADVPSSDPLMTRQEAVAIRYQRFEATLLQLAEYLRRTDPDRAELLVRALGKSKEARIPDQLRRIVELLSRDQLGDAVSDQEEVLNHMQTILQLLQSEDRQDELEREKKRLQELIRQVDRLIGKEQDVRSATERFVPSDQVQQQQRRVEQDTQQLLEKIRQQDQERLQEAEQRARTPTVKNQRGSEDQDDPSTPSPVESEPKQPSESSTPQSSAPEQKSSSSDSEQSTPHPSAQPSPSSPSAQDSPSTPMRTPGREELERAQQQMQQAIERLEQQQREQAGEHQDIALAELRKAKQQLEELLRQLREEERQLLLLTLEARFREMLARQVQVHQGSQGLATIPEPTRSTRHRPRAIELSRQQAEITLLAEKTLSLLREEGSSVAFPEALAQIRNDMQHSAQRLEQVDVGELTLFIQRDIIEALEEMLDALQKEMEKHREQQQNPSGQPGEPGQDPLVDAIAELKMLRSLQFRVNRRTRQIGHMITGEQTQDHQLMRELQQLAERQAKIQQTTADLAKGKNR